MVSTGDVEGDDFFDPAVLGGDDGGLDLGFLAGDDDLAGRVEIGGLDVEGGAEIIDRLALFAEDCGHGSGGLFAGELHEAASFGDDPEAGGEVKYARCRQRGDLAEAQAKGELHVAQLALFLEDGVDRETMDEKRGLADLRLGELGLGAFEANFGQIPAEHTIGLVVEGACGGGVFVERLAHADLLGALSGENKCGSHVG